MEQLSRRLFLEVGTALGAGAMGMRATLDLQAAETRGKILPLVVFFQGGAQSPYEFVSPLVDSPKEIRGEHDAICARTGIPIDERWPKFAGISDKTAIIRSLDAGNVNHDAVPVVGQPGKLGERLSQGGIPHPLVELPSTFSDLSKLDRNLGMHIKWNADEKRFQPPAIEADPLLDERMKLLRTLERPMTGTKVTSYNQKRELAATLLSGKGTPLRSPFESAEKERERYGNHPIGDACALASGFAQSGAGVTIIYNEFGRGWDLHSQMKEGYEAIIPPTDHALTELILDARRHGFVVLMTSEHGRTPKINSSGGRDHWQTDYAVLAGGSVQEGAVIGSVGKDGNIEDGHVKGPELMRTTLKACGIEPELRMEVIKGVLRK